MSLNLGGDCTPALVHVMPQGIVRCFTCGSQGPLVPYLYLTLSINRLINSIIRLINGINQLLLLIENAVN